MGQSVNSREKLSNCEGRWRHQMNLVEKSAFTSFTEVLSAKCILVECYIILLRFENDDMSLSSHVKILTQGLPWWRSG